MDFLHGIMVLMVIFCAFRASGQTIVGLWVPGGTDSPKTTTVSVRISVPFNFTLPSLGSVDITGVGVWLLPMLGLASTSNVTDTIYKENLTMVTSETLVVTDATSYDVDGFSGSVSLFGEGHFPSGLAAEPLGTPQSADCVSQWLGVATDGDYIYGSTVLTSCLDSTVRHTASLSYTDPSGTLTFHNVCNNVELQCSPTQLVSRIAALELGETFCYKASFFWEDPLSTYADFCGLKFLGQRGLRPTPVHRKLSVHSGQPFLDGQPVSELYKVRFCRNSTTCDFGTYAEVEDAAGLHYLLQLSNPAESLDLVLEIIDLAPPSRRRRCTCFVTCFGFGSCGGSGASKASVQKAVDTLTNEINEVQGDVNTLVTGLRTAIDSQQTAIVSITNATVANAAALQSLSAFTYNSDANLEAHLASLGTTVNSIIDGANANALSAKVTDSIARSQMAFIERALADISRITYRDTIQLLDDTGNVGVLFGDDWADVVVKFCSHLGYFPVDMSNPVADIRVNSTDEGAEVELSLIVAPIGQVYHVDRFSPVYNVPIQITGNETVFTPCGFQLASAFRLLQPVSTGFAAQDSLRLPNNTATNATTGTFYRACDWCVPAPVVDDGSHTLALLHPPVPQCVSIGTVTLAVSHKTQFGKEVRIRASPGSPLSVGLYPVPASDVVSLVYDGFDAIARDISSSTIFDEWDEGVVLLPFDNVTTPGLAPLPPASYLVTAASAARAANDSAAVIQDFDNRLDVLENRTSKNFTAPTISGSSCSAEFAGVCFDKFEHVMVIIGIIIAVCGVTYVVFKLLLSSGKCARRRARESKVRSANRPDNRSETSSV